MPDAQNKTKAGGRPDGAGSSARDEDGDLKAGMKAARDAEKLVRAGAPKPRAPARKAAGVPASAAKAAGAVGGASKPTLRPVAGAPGGRLAAPTLASAHLERIKRLVDGVRREQSDWIGAVLEARLAALRGLGQAQLHMLDFATESTVGAFEAARAVVGAAGLGDAIRIQRDFTAEAAKACLEEARTLSGLGLEAASQSVRPVREQASRSVERVLEATRPAR